MQTDKKFQLIAAGLVVGTTIYGHYQSKKIERTIAEGQKKMAEQTFTLYIPVPPEF